MSNELTIHQAEGISLYDVREDTVRYPRLASLPVDIAVEQLSGIVANAFAYRGSRADEDTVAFIAENLYQELMMEKVFGAKQITMVEIARAVKSAVLTEDMFGVSVASLFKVILNYVKGEGHQIQVAVNARSEKRYQLMQQEYMKRLSEMGKRIEKTHKV